MRVEGNRFVDRTAAGGALAGAVKKLRLRRPDTRARALRVEACPLPMRWRSHCGRPSMFSWCARSGCPVSRSLRSARLPRAVSSCASRAPLGTRRRWIRASHSLHGANWPSWSGVSVSIAPACRRSSCAGRPWCSSMMGWPPRATMLAAVRAARAAGAAFVVVAAPVASDRGGGDGRSRSRPDRHPRGAAAAFRDRRLVPELRADGRCRGVPSAGGKA